MNTPIEVQSGVMGRYKIEAVTLDEDGNELSRRVCADWFNNLITDQGLEYMGNSSNYFNACQVGTGSTAPSVLDTQLSTYLAGTATKQNVNSTVQIVSTPYYASLFITYRFAAGVAAGNLAEVGVGRTTTTGNLYSHALILDGGGSPTTITVLPTEALDVTYEHRTYAPVADVLGNVTISGVNYSYTLRPCRVGSSNFGNGGWGVENTGTDFTDGTPGVMVYPLAQTAYNGSMVAPNAGDPTGSNAGTSSSSAAAYVPGSLYAQMTQTYDLNFGNLAGGITVVKFSVAWCTYQVGFSPAIPKDATKTLTLTFRHSWTRAVIP